MYYWIISALLLIMIIYLLVQLIYTTNEGFQTDSSTPDISGTDLSGTDLSGVDLSVANLSVNTLPISSIIPNLGLTPNEFNNIAIDTLDTMSKSSSIIDTGSQSYLVPDIDLSKIEYTETKFDALKTVKDSLSNNTEIDRRGITDKSRYVDTLNTFKEMYVSSEEEYRLQGDWKGLQATRGIVKSIENHLANNLR